MLAKNFRVYFLCFFSLLACAAAGQEEAAFPFPVSSYKLKNGLQVILSEDYSFPLIAVAVAYHVGSIHEQPGKTGLAYLLENLMFMGSLNIGPMQHISYINRIGGEPNASTTEDITSFYQTAPSNQLALVLWLESDRMKSLDINPAKVLRAREALLDEIGQRKSNEPYLESLWAFDRLLFPDFAYSHGILGKEEDIRSLSAEDVNNFYAAYYVPSNAVLCIVGNIELVKTKELVEKYFGSIPQGKELPLFSPPAKPPEKKSLVQTFPEPLAPYPGFHLAYRMAPPFSPDSYGLTVLDYILLKGKSSRLYKRIIRRENLASYLSGGIEKRKDLAALKIFCLNNTETMVDLCQKAIFSEIQKLRTSYISEEELRKAKTMLRRDYLHRFILPLEKALYLAEMFFSPVGLEKAPQELDKFLRVTPFEVVGLSNRYLTPENSLLLNVKTR